MFTKVLFPIDFSGCSVKITDFAIKFALNHNSELIFFHVLDNDEKDATVDYSQFKSEVEVKLDDLANKSEIIGIENVKDLVWDIVTVDGTSAAAEIVDYSENPDNKIDVILIPSHRKAGIRRFLIGSTAEKVVRHATVPVLTVKTPK